MAIVPTGNPGNGLRAALYARVSTRDQVDGTSLDVQRERCTAFIASKDWQLVGEYVDEGLSGARSDRPEWQRLLEDVRSGEVQVVVVYKLDRFSRSTRDALNAIETLRTSGALFASVSENIDVSTPSGRLQLRMLASVAEFERDVIAERGITGQRAKALRGGWPGGAAPYGYRLDGQGHECRCVVDERESRTLLLAVKLLVDDGLSTGQVCARLNALGLRPRQSPLWKHQNLRRILLPTAPLGFITYGDPDSRTSGGHRATGRYGPPIRVEIPPLMTQDRWNALQAALERKATGKRRDNAIYTLSGRMQAPCGMTYGGVQRKDYYLRQYRCARNRWTATGEARCSDPRLNADVIESAVWQAVTKLLAKPERLLAMAGDYLGLRSRQVGVEREALADVDARIASHRRAMTETATEYMKAGVPADTLTAALKVIQAELDQLERHRTDLLVWQQESEAESTRMRELWALAEAARTRLQVMTLAEQAEVLRLLDVNVTVLDNSKTPALHVEGRVFPSDLLGAASTDDKGLAHLSSTNLSSQS